MRKPSALTQSTIEPTEDDIRAYAYHLYQQSGCVPGHDLDNWLEARACILSNIPVHRSRSRLHRHLNPVVAPDLEASSTETEARNFGA
jgi:hypothetical protein